MNVYEINVYSNDRSRRFMAKFRHGDLAVRNILSIYYPDVDDVNIICKKVEDHVTKESWYERYGLLHIREIK